MGRVLVFLRVIPFFCICAQADQADCLLMDEQHPPPPLEYKYSGGLRNELGISERLSGLAIAGEGSVSAAAPFRQNQEDTNATEPVEDHRKTLEARTKVDSCIIAFRMQCNCHHLLSEH